MEFRHAFWLLKKWFVLIVLACIVGALAGQIVSLLKPELYQAETMVYFVTPNHTDIGSITGDQQVAAAFANIPKSGSVLTATLLAIHDRSLTAPLLSSEISVINDRDTQFVTIQVRDSSPTRAARLATLITEQSIAQFNALTADKSQAKQFVKQELSQLQVEISALEKQLTALQHQKAGASSNPSATPASSAASIQPTATPTASSLETVDQLTATLNADRALYNQLLDSYTNITSAEALVLQQAQVPQQPVGLGRAPVVAIGLLVGLLAAVALILFIEQQRGILRPTTDIAPMNAPSGADTYANNPDDDITLKISTATRKAIGQALSAYSGSNGLNPESTTEEHSAHSLDDQA